LVVVQGLRVVTLGVGIGLAAALAGTRLLTGLLYEVEAVDGGTFVGMALAMIAVGAAASYVPARRASNVEPIESLRGD
jgi:ABC-type antimicrobial peptide transport system permease subunit